MTRSLRSLRSRNGSESFRSRSRSYREREEGTALGGLPDSLSVPGIRERNGGAR